MNIRAAWTQFGLYPPNLLMGEEAMAAAVERVRPPRVACFPIPAEGPQASARRWGCSIATVSSCATWIRLVVRPGLLILEPFAGPAPLLQAAAMRTRGRSAANSTTVAIPLIKERFGHGIGGSDWTVTQHMIPTWPRKSPHAGGFNRHTTQSTWP